MRKIITGDGSETVYNEDYDEYYHSKSGALEEAFEKYVKPCRIKELAKKGYVRVLDIGFGLGYNAIAAIDAALEEGGEIEVFSFEKDPKFPEKTESLNPELENYYIIRKLEYDPITKTYSYEAKNVLLRIKIGDAAQRIRELNLKFDAVFLDPFSPAKNPELWTSEFFSDIAKRMKKGAVLATYSYAKKIRENLKKSGFHVYDGPVVGRRSPCTLAEK